MSEYTPTTEEVSWAVAEHLGWDAAFPGGAFERWLAEERRAAAENAWDEGCVAAAAAIADEHGPVSYLSPHNPYRAKEVAPDGR